MPQHAAQPDLIWQLTQLPTVRNIGRSIFDPIWAQQEHVDHSSELLHVLQGQVRIVTPAYTITGREGDTLYTPANVPHKDVFPPGSRFEVYLVQFNWPWESALLQRYSPPQLCEAASHARHALAEEFDRLHRDFVADLPLQRELLSLRLTQILCRLCRHAQMIESPAGAEAVTAGSRRTQIMARARQVIHEMCHQPLSLERIADAVGVSPYYLSRVFSDESGFTLSSYLTRVRMEKAAQLLREPGRSVKAVALAVGFRDSHYFSRVFRSHYQVAPSAYRAKKRA